MVAFILVSVTEKNVDYAKPAGTTWGFLSKLLYNSLWLVSDKKREAESLRFFKYMEKKLMLYFLTTFFLCCLEHRYIDFKPTVQCFEFLIVLKIWATICSTNILNKIKIRYFSNTKTYLLWKFSSVSCDSFRIGCTVCKRFTAYIASTLWISQIK